MRHEAIAKRKAAKLFGGIEFERAGRGKVGYLQADGTFHPNVSIDLEAGLIWVLLEGERSSVSAIPMGISGRFGRGFDVNLKRDRVTRALYAFLDVERAAASVGWEAALTLAIPDTAGDLDDSTVQSRRLKMGRAYSPTADLVFRASGFWYRDSDGELKWWNDKIQDSNHEVDFSANIPGSANQHKLVIVSLNPDASTPALAKTAGSDVSISTTFAEDDIETLIATVNTGYIPLFAAELINGDTAIPESQLWDVREFFTNPSSNTVVSLGAPPSTNEGRLTLTTGVPVTTTDVTGATTVYWTPYKGNYIGLHDGSSGWSLHALSEKSLSLSGLVPWSIHDIFMDYNAGTPVLAKLAWTAGATAAITNATNATPIVITSNGHGLSDDDIVTISGVGGNTAANGTFRVASSAANTFALTTLAGANVAGSGSYTSGGTWYKANYVGTRATALTLQDGILVLTGATDWRYLGTLAIGATAGETADSSAAKQRLLWNYYNRVERSLLVTESTDTWSHSSSVVRAARNDLANRAVVVIGAADELIRADMTYMATITAASAGMMGVGIDTPATNSAQVFHEVGAIGAAGSSHYQGYPSAGMHNYYWVEFRRAGTMTFWGDAGFPTSVQSGMLVALKA